MDLIVEEQPAPRLCKNGDDLPLYALGVCRKCYDVDRRGRLGGSNIVEPGTCSVHEDGDRCDKPEHAAGMCQMHYRRVRRTGLTRRLKPSERIKPGPAASPDAVSHVKLDPAEKERRRVEREDAANAVTHCLQGHPFDASNTYMNPKTGRRVCRACQRANQAAYQARRRARQG